MAMDNMPTVEELRKLLEYSPETGEFKWKPREAHLFTEHRQAFRANVWNTRYAGKPAFTAVSGAGYYCGRLFGVTVLAHRVAWALMNDRWPDGQIDHINGDKTDNKASNLRVVTQVQNLRNCKKSKQNTTGFTGVYKSRAGNWYAQIHNGVKAVNLGTFSNLDAAVSARMAAESALGYASGHGKR